MERDVIDSEPQHAEQRQVSTSNMALRTFMRENYDLKMYFANTFACVPSHKTPPPSVGTTKPFNPFNHNLRERLESATLSPTVFERVLSPREASSTELRWTIDDISKCNPANIDEESVVDVIDNNEETREDVQQAIDRYFSQTHMPSPWNVVPKDFSSPMTGTPGSGILGLKKDSIMSSTPKKSGAEQRIRFVSNVSTQTTLSLPAKLPDHIEELLRPYCNVVKDDDLALCDEDESILSVSNRRRKLDFSRNLFSPRFDADDSMGSNTSLDKIVKVSTPLPPLSSPELSPIHNTNVDKKIISRNISARLNFTQEMNVCTFSAECNDESKFVSKANDSAMSMTASTHQIETDMADILSPLPLTSTTNMPNFDTGYHTDITGSTSDVIVSKDVDDVTFGFTGFSNDLDKAQMDLRHLNAVSTPTKTAKINL